MNNLLIVDEGQPLQDTFKYPRNFLLFNFCPLKKL